MRRTLALALPIALLVLGPLSVGGTYDTAVSLKENDCSNVTVQPNPTTVTHKPGESTLTLNHAGTDYPGTINPDGSFETEPKVLPLGRYSVIVSIAGKFSRTGFEADVQVEMKTAAPCSYVVHWVGTRAEGTNELPGKL